MITNQGPKVLEYNVRFGDPECQPLLMRLKTDLVDLLEATVDGRLDEIAPLEWDPRPAVCVVMASEGYPGKYDDGQPIRGLDDAAQARPTSKSFTPARPLPAARWSPTAAACWASPPWARTIPSAKLHAYQGREVHPLEGRLVPEGYFRQGDEAGVAAGRLFVAGRRFILLPTNPRRSRAERDCAGLGRAAVFRPAGPVRPARPHRPASPRLFRRNRPAPCRIG